LFDFINKSAFKKMQNRFLLHWLHASSDLSRRSGVRLAQFATNLAVFLVVLSILLLAAAARCHDTLISPAFHRREAARTVTPHFLTLGLEATATPDYTPTRQAQIASNMCSTARAHRALAAHEKELFLSSDWL
jgi:hypothetical protein